MIFNTFNTDDVVTGRTSQVSSGMFAGELYIDQSTFITSSTQGTELTSSSGKTYVKNGQYYVDVYSGTEQYFSIAYGDYVNSGSSLFNDPAQGASGVFTNESKVIYTQYRNFLLQPGDNLFTFASGSVSTTENSEAIFVMNFSSDKFKDQLDPGQFQVNFAGTNGVFSYIDDSSVVNKDQNVYNLISGSVVSGVPTPYSGSTGHVYEGIGLVYPRAGTVVFNAINLDARVGITGTAGTPDITTTRASNATSTDVESSYRVWSREFFLRLTNSSLNMSARRSEYVPSTHYFVRVKNRDFNYTNNPTFISDGTDGKTKGTIIHQDLINSPKTYITTIGLYSENNELLAVGKLSKPTQKSFDSELLIKTRIDF
jgi:hypothetical protein